MFRIFILFIISFSPAIAYAIWIRNTEKYEREPWNAILSAFLWGASIAIVASLIIEMVMGISLASSIHDYGAYSFIMAVLIAPFAEEFAKPIVISLRNVRKEINEEEDGLIYGAISGLGFSATENLFYSMTFISKGFILFLILVAIRTIGGCLLHASATAFTGYGYGKALLEGKGIMSVMPFFFVAIAIHSAYNFILSFEIIGGIGSIILAVLFAILCIKYVRKKIKTLDRIKNI